MLNLTDHLRRLRVDKYEYVAMKVIVLLQSGMLSSIKWSITVNTCQVGSKFNWISFTCRHIWFAWTGASAWMSREGIACIANIHSGPLPGCPIEIWWATLADTRTATDVPGKSESNFQVIQSIIEIHFYFVQVGKEMLTIKSKDGAEFNLLLELLRGEHWQFFIYSTEKNNGTEIYSFFFKMASIIFVDHLHGFCVNIFLC